METTPQKRVLFSLSEAEHTAFRKACIDAGVSMSSWVAEKVREFIADTDDTEPEPAPAPVKPAEPDAEAIERMWVDAAARYGVPRRLEGETDEQARMRIRKAGDAKMLRELKVKP